MARITATVPNIYGGMLNEMVIAIRNGIWDTSSNPGQDCLSFILHQYL